MSVAVSCKFHVSSVPANSMTKCDAFLIIVAKTAADDGSFLPDVKNYTWSCCLTLFVRCLPLHVSVIMRECTHKEVRSVCS